MPPRSSTRNENIQTNTAQTPLSSLPSKHRAVRSFVKDIPADQREDALLQAVLVGLHVINENGGTKSVKENNGRPGKAEKEAADAVEAGDRTQWIHPVDADSRASTPHAEEDSRTEGELTIDDLGGSTGQQNEQKPDRDASKPNPRIYPEWWGYEEYQPGQKKSASVNGAARVKTRTRTGVEGSTSVNAEAQTITTTTTTVTVVEPLPAGLPSSAVPPRPMPLRDFSAPPKPQKQEEKTPTTGSTAWEIPPNPTLPTRSKPRPRPTSASPESERDPTPTQPRQQPSTQPARQPTSPPTPPQYEYESGNADPASPGLMELVRQFLRDPIVECLDLGVLNMRFDEDGYEDEDGAQYDEDRYDEEQDGAADGEERVWEESGFVRGDGREQ